MSIAITNQDCSSLSEIDLEEMAQLSGFGETAFGILSKERDLWVTAFIARNNSNICGFVLATLERIGGTPTVLFGLAAAGSARVVQSLSDAVRRKARVAFPDEDVIFALRAGDESALVLLEGVVDPNPVPRGRPGGEERAWARRLAKRFEIDQFDESKMVAKYGEQCRTIQFPNPPKFVQVHKVAGTKSEYTLAWGWAQVELLENY